MKILLVGPGCGVPIPPNGWGGIEKVIWKHSEYLKKNHQVDILNERNSSKLKTMIKNNNYDIIHAHEEWGLFELNKIGIPFCYTCHSGGWLFALNFIKSLFDKSPYNIPFEQMFAHKELDIKNKYAIYNGADKNVFFPENKKKNKCIAIGKNDPRKKFDKILEVFKNKPDYEIHFIGPDCDQLKGPVNVFTHPNMSEKELSKHLNDAEYLFHLAEAEADALVVKEACMSGCKLILSDYCAETVGRDISFTDYENFEQCPEDLGEKARQRALEKFDWDIVGKRIEEIYLDINREINPKVGFYLQIYKNREFPEFTLKHIRKYYPESKIYLVSDDGDNFSDLAKKYNCEYEHSNINTGVRPEGFNKEQMLEWLRRFKACFDYCSDCDYVVYAEDDLIIRGKIKFDKEKHISGVVENVIGKDFIEYCKNYSKNSYFNSDLYGACGGTIYNTKTFLSIYQNMISFVNEHFDHIYKNISNKIAYLDCALPVFFMMNGYGYYKNENLIETDRGHNWIESNCGMVHVQNDNLLTKIVRGNHRYE